MAQEVLTSYIDAGNDTVPECGLCPACFKGSSFIFREQNLHFLLAAYTSRTVLQMLLSFRKKIAGMRKGSSDVPLTKSFHMSVLNLCNSLPILFRKKEDTPAKEQQR